MSVLDLKRENEHLSREEGTLQNEICRSRPIKLAIKDTGICNLNCIMCQRNAKRFNHPLLYNLKKSRFLGKTINRLNNCRLIHYKNAIMNFSLFEKIANETFPYLQYLYLTVSGEPLINKNFYQELDLVEKFKVKLILFTNATHFPKDSELNRIINNLEQLIVSFDAAHKKTYERIRRFAQYEKVIDNIRRFNKVRKGIKARARPGLKLKLVLMRSNIEELCDWVKLAKDLEVDSIVVSHVLIFDKDLLKESLIYYKELANYHIEQARGLASRLNVKIDEFPALYTEEIKGDYSSPGDELQQPCEFLWQEAFIETDGSVYPCCASVKQGLWMGNVGNQTFDQIWNGHRYQALRHSFKTGNILSQCRVCYHRKRFRESDHKRTFILCRE